MKTKTRELTQTFFEVRKHMGVWEVSKDDLLYWEEKDRLTAMEKARKQARKEGIGVRVSTLTGRIWREEQRNHQR